MEAESKEVAKNLLEFQYVPFFVIVDEYGVVRKKGDRYMKLEEGLS